MRRNIVGRPLEILLVEDDLAEAQTTLQDLKQQHVRCRVTLVRDGEEAMAFLYRRGIFARAPRPDLILLDMELPKMDGAEVLARITADEDLKTIPVVVLTDPPSCETEGETYPLPIHDFMPKPLDLQRLIRLAKSLHYSVLERLVQASLAECDAAYARKQEQAANILCEVVV